MAGRSDGVRSLARTLLVACSSCLLATLADITSGVAADFTEALPLFNRHYLVPEIAGYLWPSCQIMVHTPVPRQFGVTSDDLLYCELPQSWFPSDRCTCAHTVGGVRTVRSGMVVWRPRLAPYWPGQAPNGMW